MTPVEILKATSQLQNSLDSGWVLDGEGRCYACWARKLFIDHEPTEAYLKTLYSSAPLHNFESRKIDFENSTGLWCVKLWATLDTSD